MDDQKMLELQGRLEENMHEIGIRAASYLPVHVTHLKMLLEDIGQSQLPEYYKAEWRNLTDMARARVAQGQAGVAKGGDESALAAAIFSTHSIIQSLHVDPRYDNIEEFVLVLQADQLLYILGAHRLGDAVRVWLTGEIAKIRKTLWGAEAPETVQRRWAQISLRAKQNSDAPDTGAQAVLAQREAIVAILYLTNAGAAFFDKNKRVNSWSESLLWGRAEPEWYNSSDEQSVEANNIRELRARRPKNNWGTMREGIRNKDKTGDKSQKWKQLVLEQRQLTAKKEQIRLAWEKDNKTIDNKLAEQEVALNKLAATEETKRMKAMQQQQRDAWAKEARENERKQKMKAMQQQQRDAWAKEARENERKQKMKAMQQQQRDAWAKEAKHQGQEKGRVAAAEREQREVDRARVTAEKEKREAAAREARARKPVPVPGQVTLPIRQNGVITDEEIRESMEAAVRSWLEAYA